jgi:hypothetical protein
MLSRFRKLVENMKQGRLKDENVRNRYVNIQRGFNEVSHVLSRKRKNRLTKAWFKLSRLSYLGQAHSKLVEESKSAGFQLGELEASRRLEERADEMERAAFEESVKVQEAMTALQRAKDDAIACGVNAEETAMKTVLEYENKFQELEQLKLELMSEKAKQAKFLELKHKELAEKQSRIKEEETSSLHFIESKQSEVEKAKKLEKEGHEKLARGEELAVEAMRVLKQCEEKERKLFEEMKSLKKDIEAREETNMLLKLKHDKLMEIEKKELEEEQKESRRKLEEIRKKETELELKALATNREVQRRERRCEELEVG